MGAINEFRRSAPLDSPATQQFATRCCQLHICHDIGQALYGMDMSVKGVAYQAHYHESPSQSQQLFLAERFSYRMFT